MSLTAGPLCRRKAQAPFVVLFEAYFFTKWLSSSTLAKARLNPMWTSHPPPRPPNQHTHAWSLESMLTYLISPKLVYPKIPSPSLRWPSTKLQLALQTFEGGGGDGCVKWTSSRTSLWQEFDHSLFFELARRDRLLLVLFNVEVFINTCHMPFQPSNKFLFWFGHFTKTCSAKRPPTHKVNPPIAKPTLCTTCIHLEAPNVCMWYIVLVLRWVGLP